MEKYIQILYKLAKRSAKNGDIPVGALVIYNGKIVGTGYNTRYITNKVTGHAEINAIIKAEKNIGDFRLNNCILFTTLMPCNMCLEVIKEARITKVYYILDTKKSTNFNDNINLIKYENSENEFVLKYKQLFLNFFKKLR